MSNVEHPLRFAFTGRTWPIAHIPIQTTATLAVDDKRHDSATRKIGRLDGEIIPVWPDRHAAGDGSGF